jgi:hypothetical protein
VNNRMISENASGIIGVCGGQRKRRFNREQAPHIPTVRRYGSGYPDGAMVVTDDALTAAHGILCPPQAGKYQSGFTHFEKKA